MDESDRALACEQYGLTLSELQKLSEGCIDAKTRAYCPYSNFRVGCSILLKDESPAPNKVFTGVNVENAAYPVGTCAERCAFGTAVAEGLRYGDVKAVGVATDIEMFCSPCGMCRQFMREFCEGGTPIFMHNKDNKFMVKKLEELLPMSFGPQHLDQKAENVANGPIAMRTFV
ncbi:cytidine deaminase [Rhizodiscina lignyota]|uniref:Cytidine deaminase n=1 Tax=Rhizodiscina lignyota TaxID=1504668 RepID=A0A9P4M1Y2_9PEZI|nr:cytidine deaminase [Rhizodiscina lignyota]